MFLHKFNSCSFSGIQHFFLLIQTHTPHTYRSWIPNGTKRSEDCAESTVSALLNGNVMENVSDKKRNVHHWCIYFMRCCLFVKPFLTIVIVVLHSLPSSSTSTKHSKKSERDEILREEKTGKKCFVAYYLSFLRRIFFLHSFALSAHECTLSPPPTQFPRLFHLTMKCTETSIELQVVNFLKSE